MIGRLPVVLLSFAALAQEQATEFTRARFEVIVPLLRQNRYAEAEQLTRDLLARAEAQVGPESLEVGRILTLLTDCRFRLGHREDPETVGYIERAVRIKTQTLGADHDETVQTSLVLAAALHNAARVAEARAIYERILAKLESGATVQSPRAIEILNEVAVQLYEAGEHGRARVFAERALERAERLYGPERPETAHVLSTMGFVLQAAGDLGGARTALERALRIRETKLGAENRLTIASYNNLGIALVNENQFAEALRLYEKANAAREKILGPEHPDNAIGLHNMADALTGVGDVAGARSALERALALRLRKLGEIHVLTGTTLSRLAVLNLSQSQLDAALTYVDRAIDVFRRTVGPSHPYYLQAQALRAQILARLGRTAAAFGESVAAARQWTEHIRLTAQSMAERQALTYGLSDQLTAAELATALALDQPELGGAARREVWDHWIRARALVLDEMTARQRLVGRDADPELARLHWGLVDERRRLARLVLSAGGENTAERIAEAMRRKDRLERDLGDRSVTLRRDLRRGQIGFADVAAQLPPRSALVAFVRFRRDVPAAPKRAWVAAFVLLSGEEEPVLLPVAEESELEALVRDWRSRIAMAASDPLRAGKRAEALMRATGERLRRKIWDPLALYLGRAERVFLVPEGALHLVNFAALPTGTDRYLIESGPLLHTLSAERDLVPPESLRRGSNLLALANPAFSGPSPRRPPGAALRGATPACADLRQVRFGPLPATAGEVREIARLWPDANPTVLSGAQASETEFRAQAPGKRIVHVATHGFFQGEQCGASRLVGEAAGQSPLVFSGLALAGANRRQTAKEDEEDGMLTAEEIAGLDLEGVEWVVLSGCDTGLGQIRSRDGVFGMRRAFQTAGAATVIMSLWPVEDRAARDWMRALYANRLSRRLSTAEALREAGRSALQARRQSGRSTHPFFWAAFVGAGDWR